MIDCVCVEMCRTIDILMDVYQFILAVIKQP